MSVSNPTYLYHCPYGYYFRLRIPVDLKINIGKTELRYSLRTNILSVANSKARLLTGKVQNIFRQLRSNRDFDATLTLVTGYDSKRRTAVIKRWRELEEGKATPVVEVSNR